MTGIRLRRVGSAGPVAMWTVMRRLTRRTGSWTIDQVASAVPQVARNTVECYVAACRRAGHVAVVETRATAAGTGRENLYSVNLNSSVAPFEKDRPVKSATRPGTVQLQLWTAMRRLPSWTSQELALAASTDEVAVSVPVARKYAAALRKAGYVQEVEAARSSRSFGRHRLRQTRNTGPNPPVLRLDGSVVDRNERQRATR